MCLLWSKSCRLAISLGIFTVFHSAAFCDSGTNIYGIETESQQFYLGSSLALTHINSRPNDYGYLQVYDDISATNDKVYSYSKIYSYAAELGGQVYAANPVSAIFLNYTPLQIANDKLPVDWPAGAVSAANISRITNTQNNKSISAVSLNQDIDISPDFSATLRMYTNVSGLANATLLAANNSTSVYDNGQSAASVFDLHTPSDVSLSLSLQGSPTDSTSDSVNLTSYAAASTVAVSSSIGGSSLAMASGDEFNIAGKSADLGNGAYISSEANILSPGNSKGSAVSAGIGSALYGCGSQVNTIYNINNFGTNIGTNGIIFSLASNSAGTATSVGIGNAIDKISIASQITGGIGKTTIGSGTTVAAYASGNNSTAVGIGTAMTNITDTSAAIQLTGGKVSIGDNTTIIAANASTAVGIGGIAGGNKMTGGSIIFKGPSSVVAISNGTTNKSVAIGGDVSNTAISFDAYSGDRNGINLIALNGALSESSTTFSLANPTLNKSISLRGDSKIVIGGVYNSSDAEPTTSAGTAPTVNIYGGVENSDNGTYLQVVSGAIANMYGSNTGLKKFIIDSATVNLCGPAQNIASKTISIPSVSELTAGKRKMKDLTMQFTPAAASLTIDSAGSFALNDGALLTLGNGNHFSYGGQQSSRSSNSEIQINSLGNSVGGLEPSTFLNSDGQFYGLYSKTEDGALVIDNTLALTGTSVLKVGSGDKIKITGKLAFVGDSCSVNFSSGVIENQSESSYELRNISALTLSKISSNFANLYTTESSTNLDINNKFILSDGTYLNLISGDTLSVSGTLVIDEAGLSPVNVVVDSGAAFTHAPGSTFEISNVANLNVTQFASGQKYRFLYNSCYDSSTKTLTLDNTLAFGGTTTMSFAADQHINIESGALSVRDEATLALDGTSTGNIIGSSPIVHDLTTTFKINNLAANLSMSDFTTGKYKTLYEKAGDNKKITVDNALSLQGKTLALGSGDTIVFSGASSSFYSNATQSSAQNVNSSYIFLNTTVNTDSFGTGSSGTTRFQNLNKNANAIENNVIVGDYAGTTPATLCVNKTNFALKTGAKLAINDGSTLKFLRNGSNSATVDCTISATANQVTHTTGSIFEFSGVTRNLQVSKFKTNSSGGSYYNLYNGATSSNLPIDNTIKLSSSEDAYPSLFKVDGTLDISNGKFIVEDGSTLLFSSSTNSKIIGAATALEKSSASIISLGSSFTVPSFTTGNNLASIYNVNAGILNVDNVLNITSGGKLTLESGYGLNIPEGAQLSLTQGTLSFESGNNGIQLGSSNQVTKSADSICEFKNIALSLNDFAAGGKYSNLYVHDDSEKSLSIDNVFKLTTASGTTPPASFTLNGNETLNVAGTLNVGSGSAVTVNSGAKIAFCGDAAKVSNSGIITLDPESTTVLAGMSNATLSTFATNGSLAGLYSGASSSSLNINNILELGSYKHAGTSLSIGSNGTITANGLTLGKGTALKLNNNSRFQISNVSNVSRDETSSITFNNVNLSLSMFGSGGNYQNLFPNNTIDNKIYLNGGSLTIDQPLTFSGGSFNLGSNAQITVAGAGEISGGNANTFFVDTSSTCIFKKDFNIADFASGGKYYGLYISETEEKDLSLTIGNTLEVAADGNNHTTFEFQKSQSAVLGDSGKLKIDAGSTLLFNKGSYLTGSTGDVTLDDTSTCKFVGIDFGDNAAELFFDNSSTQNYFLGLYSVPSVNAFSITNTINIGTGSKFKIGQNNIVTVSGEKSEFVISDGTKAAMKADNFLYYPNMHLHNALHAWDVKDDDRKSTFVLNDAGIVSIKNNVGGRMLSNVAPYADQAVVVPQTAFSFFFKSSLFNLFGRGGSDEYIDDTEDGSDLFIGNILEVSGDTTLVIDGKVGVGYSMEAGGSGGHMQKYGSRYEYIDMHGQIKATNGATLKFIGDGSLVFNQYVKNSISSNKKDESKTEAHDDDFTYYSPEFNYSFFDVDVGSRCEFDSLGDFGIKDFVYGDCYCTGYGVNASLDYSAKRFSTLYDVDLVVPEDLGFMVALTPRATMTVNNKMILSASTAGKPISFVLEPLNLDDDKGMYGYGKVCSILAIGNGARLQLGGDNDKASKGLKVVGSKLYNFTNFGTDQTITGPSSQWLTVKEYDPSVAENFVEFNNVGTFNLKDIGGSGKYGYIFQSPDNDATIPSLTFKLTGDSALSIGSGHIGFKGQYSRLSAGTGKVTFTTKSDGSSDAIVEIIDRGDFSTSAFGTELQQLFNNYSGTLAINKTLKLSGSSYMSVNNNLNVSGGLYFEGSSASLRAGLGVITLAPTSTVTFSGVGSVPLSDFVASGQYAKLFGDVSSGVNINNNVNFLSLVSSTANPSTLSVQSSDILNIGGTVNIGKYCKINLSGKINLFDTLLFSENLGTSDECRFQCTSVTAGTTPTNNDTVGIYLDPASTCQFEGLGTTLIPSDFSPVSGKRFAGLYPITNNVMSINNTLVCANDLDATSSTKLGAGNDVTFSVLSGNTIELQDGSSLQMLNSSGKYGLSFQNHSCGIFHAGSTCKNGPQVSRKASSTFKFVDYSDLKASDFVSGGRFGNLYDIKKASSESISSCAIDNKLYLKNSQLTIDENYSVGVEAQLLGAENSKLIIDKSNVDIANGAIFTIGTLKFIGNSTKQPIFTNEGRYFSRSTNLVFSGDSTAYDVKSSDFNDKLQVASQDSGGHYVLANLTAFENGANFIVSPGSQVIINDSGCLAFVDNCNLKLESGSSLKIDANGYLLFNGTSKIAQNDGTITLGQASEVILSNTGARTWSQFATDFPGLYIKDNSAGTTTIDNVFAIEGHTAGSGTKITLNTGDVLNVTGALRFVGNESGLIANGGGVECASSGAYELENIAVNLSDFKTGGKYSALYANGNHWNGNTLNLDNRLQIFGAARQVTVNGQTIDVPSGAFTINAGDILNVVNEATFCLGDGIPFACNGTLTHGTSTTFGLDGYNLTLSSFASGGPFEKLYGAQPSNTLTIDNMLSLGGETHLTVADGESVNLSNGFLKLADSAYLKLHGIGRTISDYSKLTVEPNTTVELADAGALTVASFTTGGNFAGLFAVTDGTLPITNTLYLSGTSVFTVGSGQTLQFDGDQSKLKSDNALTKKSGSTVSFLNTTVNSSDFYRAVEEDGKDEKKLNRFTGLYKYTKPSNKDIYQTVTIDNNFSLGIGSMLIVEDGYLISLSSSGKLLVGAGSTLRFEGGAKLAIQAATKDSPPPPRIDIDPGSITEFAGVDLDVSSFASGGNYSSLYSYDNNVVTINNSLSFLQASSFKVPVGFGVVAQQNIKLGALSTVTIDGSSNNVSFKAANVKRSPLSSIEFINFASDNFGVGSFESGGMFTNLYPVDNGILSVDNKLCLCGKISGKNTYSYPSTFVVESGKKLSLGSYGRLGMGAANSKLIFKSGNNGFEAVKYAQLQVDPGAIYEFNGDATLTDSAFVTGGKYANIFANDDSSVTIGNQVNFKSTGLTVSSKNLIVDSVSVAFDETSSFTLAAGKTLTLNSDNAKFTTASGTTNLADNSTVAFNGCGDLNLNSFTSNTSKYKGLFDADSSGKTFTTGANIKLSTVAGVGSSYDTTTLTVAAGEAFSMYSLSADEHCTVIVKETSEKLSKLQTTAGVSGEVTFSGVTFSTDDFADNGKFQNLLLAPDKACTLILDAGTTFTDKDKNYNHPTHLLSGSTFVINKALATPGIQNTTAYSTFVTRDAGSAFGLSGSSDNPLKISTLSLCTGTDDNYSYEGVQTNDNIGVLYSNSSNVCDVNNSLRLENVNLRIGGTGSGVTACGLNLKGDATNGVVGELILAGKSQLWFDTNSVVKGYRQNEDSRLPGLILDDASETTFRFDGMPNMGFSLFKAGGNLQYVYGVSIYNKEGAADYYNVTIDNCMQLSGASKFTVGSNEQVTFSGANSTLKLFDTSSVALAENYIKTNPNSPKDELVFSAGSSFVLNSCGSTSVADLLSSSQGIWTAKNKFNVVMINPIVHTLDTRGKDKFVGQKVPVMASGCKFQGDTMFEVQHPSAETSLNTIYLSRLLVDDGYSHNNAYIAHLQFDAQAAMKIVSEITSIGCPCVYAYTDGGTGKCFYAEIDRAADSTFEFCDVGMFAIDGFGVDEDEAYQRTRAAAVNKEDYKKTTLKYGGLYYNVSDITSKQTVVQNPYVSNESSSVAGSNAWMLRVDNILKLSGNSTLNITSKSGSTSSGMLDLTGNANFKNKGKIVIAGTELDAADESCLLVSSTGVLEIGAPSVLKADGTKDQQAELWIGNNKENIDVNGRAIPSYNAVIEFDYGSKFVGPSSYSANTTEGNIFKMPGSMCRFKPNTSGSSIPLSIYSFLPGAHSVGDVNYYLGIYNAYYATDGSVTTKTIEIDNKISLLGGLQLTLNSNDSIEFVGNYSGISSLDASGNSQRPIRCDSANSLGSVVFCGTGTLVDAETDDYKFLKFFGINDVVCSAFNDDGGKFNKLFPYNAVNDESFIAHVLAIDVPSLTLKDSADQYLSKDDKTFKLADTSSSSIYVGPTERLDLSNCSFVSMSGNSRIYAQEKLYKEIPWEINWGNFHREGEIVLIDVKAGEIVVSPNTSISIETKHSATIDMFEPGVWLLDLNISDSQLVGYFNKHKYAGLYGDNFVIGEDSGGVVPYTLNLINDLSVKVDSSIIGFCVSDLHTIDVKKSLTIDSSKCNILTGGTVTVDSGATFELQNTQLNVNGTLNVNGDLYFKGQPEIDKDATVKSYFCASHNSAVTFGGEASISFGGNLSLKPANFLDSDVYPGLFAAEENQDFVIKLIQQEQPLYKSYKLTLDKVTHIRDGGTFTLMMGDVLEIGANGSFIAEDGTHVVADKLSTIKVTSADNKLQFPEYVDEKTGLTKSQYSTVEFSFDECNLTPKDIGPSYYYKYEQIDPDFGKPQQWGYVKKQFNPQPKYPNVYGYTDNEESENKTYVIDNYLKFSGKNSSFTIDVPTNVTGRLAFGDGSSLIINSTNNTSNLSFDSSIVLPSNFAIGSTCKINGFNFDTRDLLTAGKLKGLYPFSNSEIYVGNNLGLYSSDSVSSHFILGAGHVLNFTNVDQQTITMPSGDTGPIMDIVNDNASTSTAILRFLASTEYAGPQIKFGFTKSISQNYYTLLGMFDMIHLGSNSAFTLGNDSNVSPYLQFDIACPLAGVNIGAQAGPIVVTLGDHWTLGVSANGANYVDWASKGAQVNIGYASLSSEHITCNDSYISIGQNSILSVSSKNYNVSSSANIGIAASDIGSAATVTANNWTVNIGDGSTLSGADVGVGVSVNGSVVSAASSTWNVSGWKVTTNGSCNIITAGENSQCFGGGNATNWTVKFEPSANNNDSVVNLVSVQGTAKYNNDVLTITSAGNIRDSLNNVFVFDNSSKIIVGDSVSASANTVKVNILGNASIGGTTPVATTKDGFARGMLLRRNGIVNVFGGTLKLDHTNLYLSGKMNLLGVDKLSKEGLSANFEGSSMTISRIGLPGLFGADAGVGKLYVGDGASLYFGAIFAGQNAAGQLIINGTSMSHISVDEGGKITLPKNLSFRFFDAAAGEVADVNQIYIGEEGVSILSIPAGVNIGDIVNIDGVPIDEYYSTSAISGEYFTWEGLNLKSSNNGLRLSTSPNGAVRKPNETARKIAKLDHIINMNKVGVETMLSAIDDRVNDLQKLPGVYVRVVGGTGHAHFGSGNSDYNSIGFVAGCDAEVVLAEDSKYLRYGLALSGIKSNSDITALTKSELDVRTFQFAGYCAYESYDNSGRKFDASLTFGYANIDDNMKRSVAGHNINTKYKNDVFFGKAALMHSLYAKHNWQIGPKVSLTAYHLSQDAVRAKSLGEHEFSLSNMTVNIVDGIFSLYAKKDIKYDAVRQNSVTLYGDFGAKCRLRTGISDVNCLIDNLQFNPDIDSFDKVGFVGSVGVRLSLYNSLNLFGQCSASITKKTSDYSFSAGVGYEF